MRRQPEGAHRRPTAVMLLAVALTGLLSLSTISGAVNSWRLRALATNLSAVTSPYDDAVIARQRGFGSVGISAAHLGFLCAELRTYRGSESDLVASYRVEPGGPDFETPEPNPRGYFGGPQVALPMGRPLTARVITFPRGWSTTQLRSACLTMMCVPWMAQREELVRDPDGRSFYILYVLDWEPLGLDLCNGSW